MVSYAVYKVIHLTGVLMVYLALGGVTLHVINGGGKDYSWRKPIAMTHGIGLFLALLGGFGLLARLGIVQGIFPTWVFAKLAIWTVFAVMVSVLMRKKSWAKSIWFITLFLGGFAAYLAGSKPF
ncbi:MAG: hypothetical protein KDD38_08250 [Bdellovibrionales bacterium]|nr:hypothetical protein [Bdellovibrionales bacterium]